jgi:hypothetical protein
MRRSFWRHSSKNISFVTGTKIDRLGSDKVNRKLAFFSTKEVLHVGSIPAYILAVIKQPPQGLFHND